MSRTLRWESGAGDLFVKVAAATEADMFAAEAAGLVELAAADAVRVPRVLAAGVVEASAWLALEWIELQPLTPAAQRALGMRLARQHRCTSARFGWHRDNTIGRTPQRNAWSTEWPAFFTQQRLQYQLDLAHGNGHRGPWHLRAGALLEQVPRLLQGHRPQPSLLHGDLWGGNAAADRDGQPVIFDPAVYYGDREADLAMTRLFGGFGPEFHAAYETQWPLRPGAAARADLYNLYHLLNHLNLFGAGYLRRVMEVVEALHARA